MRSLPLVPGLSTSIGSLPHRDPRAAVDLVMARQPRLPAAPSLPQRSGVEAMVAQAAWGIAGVEVLDDGSLLIDEAGIDPGRAIEGVDVDGPPYEGLRAFLDVVAGRTEPVKLQLTGPLTLGLALFNAGVAPDRAFAVAGPAVRARARALVARARRALPTAPLVVFLDEPGLTAAMQPGFPLGVGAAIDLVSGALAVLEPHATTGLHCCGPADWKVVLDAGPEVLSLPVGIGAVDHPMALAVHLERGGWIAWGAVPTDRPLGPRPEPLWRQLSDEWCALVAGGCDPTLLRRQALVTPACGLGLHGPAQADLVLSLTTEIARLIETQVLGTRLTVGA
ncbi:MAG: hypothetical protein AB7L84_11870 [Acidimicrobiia bacterium]